MNTKSLEELTAKQRCNLRYYLKKKNDPEYKAKRRESAAKYYNKNKDDRDFLNKLNDGKRSSYHKKKHIVIDVFLPNIEQ
jgi:hypothetical protein